MLGYFWSLIEPLLMFGILYLVFSNVLKDQVEHYQLFLLQGIIMWNFFVHATSQSLLSVAGKYNMVKKVFFPRDILVISSCLTALLMSILESLVFLVFLIFFRIPLSLNILYLPLVVVLFFLIALGTSLLLASLNVYYRDIQHIWPFVVQIGFFATPVIYPLRVFPEGILKILSYNPLAQIIFVARDVTLYAKEPNTASLLFIIGISVVILTIGYAVFSRLEPFFAEEL